MKRFRLLAAFTLGLALVLLPASRQLATPVSAISPTTPIGVTATTTIAPPPEAKPAPLPGPGLRLAEANPEQAAPNQAKSFDQVVKGLERLPGLFTLYRDGAANKLYMEVQPQQLGVNYLCTITLESGIGQAGFYSGMPLADFLFTLKRVDGKVQFTVPNVYFRTRPGDPLQKSVQRAFSSSVLQALPVHSIHPKRQSLLIDLAPLFLTDLPALSPVLSQVLGANYALDANKSYFAPPRAFPLNVELESVYGFSTGGAPDQLPAYVTVLPDSRSFNLRVRYSLSQLPDGAGYRPRLADDRLGYFITAYQNLSDQSAQEPFVRYINRWRLEKQDPQATLSPPKRPIVFWIENTVPPEYREAVRDGVLMWNKAFEAIGFKEAIVVRQMPDKVAWDPADVRYNVIRWMSSYDSMLLGIGPSRVNPLTGEILDADILIDANFARFMKRQYRNLVQQSSLQVLPSLARLTGNSNICRYGLDAHHLKRKLSSTLPPNPRLGWQMLSQYDLCYGVEAARQLAIGATALTMLGEKPATSEELNQYVQDFLRSLVAHEVGHTLGLRHNFRASAMLAPGDLNNSQITRTKGLAASVMDYSAVNLAPAGTTQGDYFTHTIGPYDYWAIAYGYTPVEPAPPQAEAALLQAIARRAPEPDLAYATDEDTFADLDPLVHPFDMSADLLTYAPWQLENALAMWHRLDQRSPRRGESFNEVRVTFDDIFDYYFQYSYFLTSYIGGQSFNRYRGGDAADRLPFEPVAPEQQRQALALLQKYVFDSNRFRFSAAFLNKLAPSRWNHWGETTELFPLEYPIYDRILDFQSTILHSLLDRDRLARLRDADLKTVSQEVLTMPELFQGLQTTIWRDVIDPPGRLRLSSLSRGLQREHMNTLIQMVLRRARVPEDARTLAWYNLRQLRGTLENTLRRRSREMDTYTKAHLEEAYDRITKALTAQLQSQ